MFKLLVLASLVALSVALPAEVVSKSAHSETIENKNDPYNPYDDTVVKKSSVQETVKTDSGVVAVDKTAAAVAAAAAVNPALFNPLAVGFNPYAPFYNPANLYNPYAYYNIYNPSSPYFNPANPLSPLNPHSVAYTPYTPYSPYSPVVNTYQARSYYAY